jgi:hypothetical protein
VSLEALGDVGDDVRRDAADYRADEADEVRASEEERAADHSLVQTVTQASDAAVVPASEGSNNVAALGNEKHARLPDERGASVHSIHVEEDVRRDSADDARMQSLAMKRDVAASFVSNDVREASAEDKGQFISDVARHAAQDRKRQSRRFKSSLPAPTAIEDAWLWRRSDLREARVAERSERQRHRSEEATLKSHMQEHAAYQSHVRERLMNASVHGHSYSAMPPGAASIRHLREAALAAQHVSEKFGEAAHTHHLEEGIVADPMLGHGHHAWSGLEDNSLSLINFRESAAKLKSNGAEIEELWR